MKILKINPNEPEEELIKLAAEVIMKDGVVVYPTDTLYGIGANATSKEAILNVYNVKERDVRKPISVAFNSLEQAQEYVEFNETSMKLARKFLPGPLTIILPVKHKLPKELISVQGVGIRIPNNKIALELIKSCGFPITATSANIAGSKDPVTADDAIKQIGGKVDLIIDGGRCKIKKPSTVIDVSTGDIKVLREGAIKKNKLNF